MNYPLTIGEVSKKYDVPVDTLGYYDEKIEVYLREGKTTPNAEKDI